jgi:hypothetical protein
MSESRLLNAMRAFAPMLFPREPFLGPRKYRLVRMLPSLSAPSSLTRCELQIVKKATDLPDQLVIEMWPGLAGALAELAPGALVLLQFIDGDAQQPIITHFATADDPAWKPVNVRLEATDTIAIDAAKVKVGASSSALELGRADGTFIREGDTIQVGAAAPGVVTLILGQGIPVEVSRVKG